MVTLYFSHSDNWRLCHGLFPKKVNPSLGFLPRMFTFKLYLLFKFCPPLCFSYYLRCYTALWCYDMEWMI